VIKRPVGIGDLRPRAGRAKRWSNAQRDGIQDRYATLGCMLNTCSPENGAGGSPDS